MPLPPLAHRRQIVADPTGRCWEVRADWSARFNEWRLLIRERTCFLSVTSLDGEPVTRMWEVKARRLRRAAYDGHAKLVEHVRAGRPLSDFSHDASA